MSDSMKNPTPNSAQICAKFSHRPASNNHHFSLNVDVQLPSSGVTGIFGHSGSGKTTLLRCIAGLEKANSGHLSINGDIWQDDNYFKPTHQRAIGYVFQEANLFPHLNVMGNLRYALKRATRTGAEQSDNFSFDHIITLLGIEKLLTQSTTSLSGGEKQRVAIARALLIKPRLLLMDEPLASLDNARKQEIIPYLEKLRSELAIPILYVSHSADEIARLANYLIALEDGEVVAQGPIADTLANIDFPIQLGEDTGVVWEGMVSELDTRWHLARIAIANTSLWIRDDGFTINQKVRLRIFAKDVSLALEKYADTSIVNILPGEVKQIAAKEFGAALIRLTIAEQTLLCSITQRSTAHLQLSPGKQVWAQIKSVAVVR